MIFQHATTVANTAQNCQATTHTPAQADALLDATLNCIELVAGITPASRPRAATPTQPTHTNRTRHTPTQPAPMNPVQRHYGTGNSNRPPNDTDTHYWRHQYHRVHDHTDRCEVIRRAGHYLNSLIRRDPNAPTGHWTDDDHTDDILINGAGWPPNDVAQRYRITERTVVITRINDNRHPLTGHHWTPPEHNAFAATTARELRAAGIACVDIAQALARNVNTIYAWTTSTRRAA